MNFLPGKLKGSQVKHSHWRPPGPRAGARRYPQRERGRATSWWDCDRSTFEDAKLVTPARRKKGHTFKAMIDLVEQLGAEQYGYFHLEGTRVESDQLSELAEDAGLAEAPSAATSGGVALVARLSSESNVERGGEAELYVEPARMHLFDPKTGDTLAKRVTA